MADEAVPIAVVGMACRLPGADDPATFWSNIRDGVTSLGPVPPERFDRELYFDPKVGVLNKSYTDLGGLIAYRPVDRNVCPVTDEMEKSYDIAHLNLCETASRAFLDAGADPFRFPVKNTGVFVGNTRGGDIGSDMVVAANLPETIRLLQKTTPFREHLDGLSDTTCERMMEDIVQFVRSRTPKRSYNGSPHTGADNAASLIAAAHGLTGPCMAFNSACASSLQALSQAVLALQQGHVDLALAGGASYFHTDTLVLFSYARSLTSNRSCPFDEEADGLVVGEGAVVVLLKRLDEAVADGDRIHAVIRGIGVASDGKGKSLWAPRKEGQIEAMRRAYGKHVAPKDVGYIEAHATSTALGDATEMEAIDDFFGDHVRGRLVPLGSTKGNVGHTIEVAGLTSFLKAILCIEHKTVPPVAGLKSLNSKIPWQDIPFYVPIAAAPWENEKDRPRIAAVNSFGIGGLNVHVVLEEFVADRFSRKKAPTRKVVQNGAKEPIAIVGYGCIFPDALSTKEFQEQLSGDKPALKRVPETKFDESILKEYSFPGRDDLPPFYGGFIDGYRYDWRKNKIPPKQIEHASPLQFMMLDAVNESFETGGIVPSQIDRKRVGVVVGTSFGSDFSVQLGVTLFLPRLQRLFRERLEREKIDPKTIDAVVEEYANLLIGKMPALVDETGSFTCSALASRITKTFDLMGGAVALDAENASSLAAMQCCVDQLRSGMNEMMICISGQQDLGAGYFEAQGIMENLAAPPFRSPFDADADGVALGEGCAAVLLKRYDDALRDGNRIFGVVRGIGAGSGSERRELQRTVVARTLEDCLSENDLQGKRSERTGLFPDVLEIATQEKTEDNVHLIDAVAALFPDGHGDGTAVGSLSNRIGHLGSGAGMAALIKALVAFSSRTYPAEIGAENIAPFIRRYRERFKIPVRPLAWNDERPRTVLISAGSFNLYHLMLQECPNEA